MGFDFRGRRVLVTGAGQGVGLAVAEAFHAAGAAVSICDRDPARLAAARQRLAGRGDLHAELCDVGEPGQVEAYVAAAAAALGGLDVLVNNAHTARAMGDETAWAENLRVGLLGQVRVTRAALPWLAAGRGCVVMIGSISAVRHSIWHLAYTPAKAALHHYATSLALRVAPQGVRVNVVAPGAVDFPGSAWEDVRRRSPEVYDGIRARIPFGRLGRPEEIADAVLFLASPAARWITGQTLYVDGGQSLGG